MWKFRGGVSRLAVICPPKWPNLIKLINLTYMHYIERNNYKSNVLEALNEIGQLSSNFGYLLGLWECPRLEIEGIHFAMRPR